VKVSANLKVIILICKYFNSVTVCILAAYLYFSCLFQLGNTVFSTKKILVMICGDFSVGKCNTWDRGGTVVKALCYKSEGRWYDPSWCHWDFSLT